MKNILNSPTRTEWISYKKSLLLTLLAYVTIYAIFILICQGLPYVFDNNETFSSLVHAQNMFHFGVKDTFGLTDEAANLAPNAHPYVYTHQGNFPRLYTLLLYALGIHSPEWQIFITTFTIGLAGIGLCHRFFAKYVSTLFALIVCLLLMTDYIMFAQWNVSTWRVWHLFFFFSSFLCCRSFNEKNRYLLIAATIANFACLFYTEMSYAAFVFFSCCLYVLLLPEMSLSSKIKKLILFSFSAFLGVGILIAQNIAYLGLTDFLKDLDYTYNGRNNLISLNLIENIIKFYRDHYIAFWINFNSEDSLRSPISILRNFYHYCLRPYGIFITLCAFISILGTTISTGIAQFKEKYNRFDQSIFNFHSYLFFTVFFAACLSFYFINAHWHFRVYTLLAMSVLFLINFTIPKFIQLIYSKKSDFNELFNQLKCMNKNAWDKLKRLYKPLNISIIFNGLFLIILIYPKPIFTAYAISLQFDLTLRIFLIVCVGIFILRQLLNYTKKNHFKPKLFARFTSSVTIINLFICLVFLGVTAIPAAWDIIHLSLGTFLLNHLYIIIYILFLAILTYSVLNNLISNQIENHHVISLIYNGYLIAIIIISSIVLQLTTQNAHSAILIEEYIIHCLKGTSQVFLVLGALLVISAPVLCLKEKHSEIETFKKIIPFLVSTTIGFILAYLLFPGYIRTGYLVRFCCFTVFAHIVIYTWLFYILTVKSLRGGSFNLTRSSLEKRIGMVATCLLIIFSYLWLSLQYYYIKEFPATDFAFIKFLRKEPYFKKSVISNTYAIPFSYITKMWGYYDPGIVESKYNEKKQLFILHHDYNYLWFRDFRNNLDYYKPTYFICWLSTYSFDLLGEPKPRCDNLEFIKYVRAHKNNTLHVSEISRDSSERDKWSIVKLDEQEPILQSQPKFCTFIPGMNPKSTKLFNDLSEQR